MVAVWEPFVELFRLSRNFLGVSWAFWWLSGSFLGAFGKLSGSCLEAFWELSEGFSEAFQNLKSKV